MIEPIFKTILVVGVSVILIQLIVVLCFVLDDTIFNKHFTKKIRKKLGAEE